jgi:hypothetical protein
MKEKIKFLTTILSLLLGIVFVFEILGLVGVFSGSNACFLRYNFGNSSQADGNFNSSYVSENITLNANGYYPGPGPDFKDEYGQWKKTQVFIGSAIDKLNISISGEVSLCRSYLPKNNLQSNNDYISDPNKKLAIPRVGEPPKDLQDNQFLNLAFDSQNFPNQWRNVTEVTFGDQLVLAINNNSTYTNVNFNDMFGEYMKADCTADTKAPIKSPTKTSPLCGRYVLPLKNGICKFRKIDGGPFCDKDRLTLTVEDGSSIGSGSPAPDQQQWQSTPPSLRPYKIVCLFVGLVGCA